MIVRRLRREEVEAWRALRLEMLSDSPSAFATTLEEAQETSKEEWAARVERMSGAADRAMFIAEASEGFVGSAGAFLDPDDRNLPHLFAMWVAPNSRGQGVGEALVEAVVRWAREGGKASLRLFVVDHNAGATALYARQGFRPTGQLVPLPRDPSVMEVEMRLQLGNSDPP